MYLTNLAPYLRTASYWAPTRSALAKNERVFPASRRLPAHLQTRIFLCLRRKTRVSLLSYSRRGNAELRYWILMSSSSVTKLHGNLETCSSSQPAHGSGKILRHRKSLAHCSAFCPMTLKSYAECASRNASRCVSTSQNRQQVIGTMFGFLPKNCPEIAP